MELEPLNFLQCLPVTVVLSQTVIMNQCSSIFESNLNALPMYCARKEGSIYSNSNVEETG
jgi:hypothetical protein